MRYTPQEVGRLLGNRVVQPHYAEHLCRVAVEQACFDAPDSPSRDPFEQMRLHWIAMHVRPDAPEPMEADE